MRIKIKTKDTDYFFKLLSILENIPPFSKLQPRDLEFYAHLLTINHKYRNIPLKERNTLIFNHDTNVEVAKQMGIKIRGVYIVLNNLRKYGIIESRSLMPKYILPKTKELTFVFDNEEN